MTAQKNSPLPVREKKVPLQARIPKSLHDEIEKFVEENDLFLVDVAEEALREYLASHSPKKKSGAV